MSTVRILGQLTVLSGVLIACAKPAPPPPLQPAPTPPAVAASAPAAPSPTGALEAAKGPRRCGALNCRLFDTPADAFATVFTHDPLIVAVGESHAKKGHDGIPSSVHRFTNELLPLFQGKASDLVLELWVADGSCGEREQQVAEAQKPVTQNQRETNRNEYVDLGNRSNELSIRPHVLRPSCEEYNRIVNAGDDRISQMLTMIADMTDRMLKAILARNAKEQKEHIAIGYGGAMHNDLKPREGRERYSFGPSLSEHTAGRYVEIDLIVPEFIGDSEVWRALPWYEHFDPHAHPDQVTLYEIHPRSYVLIFARTPNTSSAKQAP